MKTPSFVVRCVLFALASTLLLGAAGARAALLFSDSFDRPDTANIDAISPNQDSTQSGTLASAIELRSARVLQTITNQALSMMRNSSGAGRVRFHDQTNVASRLDFSQGNVGAEILAAGGFQVSFDWTPDNPATADWVAFEVGMPSATSGEPTIRVNHAETDFGILFRNNGSEIQVFDNGVATTLANPFTPGTVVVDFLFASFADGESVTANASVGGTPVLSGYGFTWSNGLAGIHMEVESLRTGTRVDNLALSTIPEPGVLALAGIGLVVTSLAVRRRRRSGSAR